MYSLTTTTPASGLPVSLADLHNHLRFSDTAEDAELTMWIQASSDLYTADTQEVLLSTVFRLNLDRFPGSKQPTTRFDAYPIESTPANQIIYLPRYPVSAVASVQYLDDTATWQTLSGTSVDTSCNPARIVLPSSLPNLHPTQLPAVRVNFTAGYADAASIPALPVLLVKLIAAHWYNNREAYGGDAMKEIPLGFKAICGQRRLNFLTDWNR